MSLTDRDRAFLDAARVAGELLLSQEVEARWAEPSALPTLTVGGLACHLAAQLRVVETLAPVASSDTPLPDADEHYRRAVWTRTPDPQDPVNDRSTDETTASRGVEAMRSSYAESLLAVERLLVSRSAADVVLIPWQGWSLAKDDLLLTRMLELVVHTDDLAHSVGVPTPVFPDAAYTPVLELLARRAAEKHGQGALVSALARRERMPDTVSAF